MKAGRVDYTNSGADPAPGSVADYLGGSDAQRATAAPPAR
jgi:hypothetical protein